MDEKVEVSVSKLDKREEEELVNYMLEAMVEVFKAEKEKSDEIESA